MFRISIPLAIALFSLAAADNVDAQRDSVSIIRDSLRILNENREKVPPVLHEDLNRQFKNSPPRVTIVGNRASLKNLAAKHAKEVGLTGLWIVVSSRKDGVYSKAQIGQEPGDLITIAPVPMTDGLLSLG